MIRLLTCPMMGTRWVLHDVLEANGIVHVHTHIRASNDYDAVCDPELPTLVTVRDLMLAVISRVNQGDEDLVAADIQGFLRMADLVADGAHPLRVDVTTDEDRTNEHCCLEDWFRQIGGPSRLDIDWRPRPRTVTPDRTGMKNSYLSHGHVSAELEPWEARLRAESKLVELMARCGYEDLPWLRPVGV